MRELPENFEDLPQKEKIKIIEKRHAFFEDEHREQKRIEEEKWSKLRENCTHKFIMIRTFTTSMDCRKTGDYVSMICEKCLTTKDVKY